MEKQIIYYYGLYPSFINEYNNYIYFKLENVSYFLCKTTINDKILKYKISLNYYNYYKLIYTLFDSFYFEYNGYKYVLFSVTDDFNEYVDCYDILKIANLIPLNFKYKCEWGSFWQKKIDFYEYQLSKLFIDDNFILDFFEYCKGMTELAIFYFNSISYSASDIKISICHRRIFDPNLKLNFFNPLSFLIDYNVRDVAEYFKSKIIYGMDNLDNIEDEFKYFINYANYSEYEIQLIFSRLLFPSIFLDEIAEYFENKNNAKNMIKYEKKIKNYESFLIFVKNLCKL